jgi:hypothetical protein
MRRQQILPLVPSALVLILITGVIAAGQIPTRLTDQEFWQLTENISEPDGVFRSDNLLSNEMVFSQMLPEFLAQTKPGGVYMGVGPEQNFTYIASMKAKMAFITDIRRENLHLMLMYKAIFELSKDRADFVSLLFTKPRPNTLAASSSVVDIMTAYWEIPTGDEAAYAANLQKIQNHLTKTHTLPLPQTDVDGVARVYRAFYWYGPAMNYGASLALQGFSGGSAATYRDLMTQTGAGGEFLTFLGTDEKFAYIKDLQARNLIVPVVGNFSGPKAIRGIGEYLAGRGVTVSAFYVSTVEPYLKRDGSFPIFCENVATLPLDDSSVFIRPGNVANLQNSGFAVAPLAPGTPRIGTYQLGVIVPMKTGCN